MNRYAYRKIVLSLVPKILSSLNRNEFSSTFGCFDKSYWFYRVVDFPCARFQEPSLTLALLYKNKFKGNIFFKNKKIKEWAIAGTNFLTKIQNKNGSFNEWYPNENTFVGTAFPIYSATEAYLILKNEIDRKIRNSLVEMFRKAGNWLARHDEKISNQQAGAIAALYNIFLITNDKKFKRNCEKKLLILEKIQSEEGWFPEYEKADFGYSFVLIDFLGKYFKKTHDKTVLKLVKPCLKFLTYFLHPDGSIGGSYGSRNTEFIVPHGIEIFSKYDNNANYIGNIIAKNIHNIANPLIMDDRFAFQYHTSYLQAFLDYKKQKIKVPKIEKEKFFEDSGLFVTNKGYYMVIGTKKGGVFRLFKGKKHIYDDSGFIAKMGNRIITSQCTNSSRLVNFDKKSLLINGKFKEVPRGFSSTKIAMFKTLISTFGKSDHVSSIAKEVLRRKLITKMKDTKIEFERKFKFQKNRIIVIDEIKDRDKKIDKLYLIPRFAPQYTPTSTFFSFDDILINKTIDCTKEFRKTSVIKRIINLVSK